MCIKSLATLADVVVILTAVFLQKCNTFNIRQLFNLLSAINGIYCVYF